MTYFPSSDAASSYADRSVRVVPGLRDFHKKDKWLARYVAFAGVPEAQVELSISTMKEQLPVLSPEQDVAILGDAGFQQVEQFCAGFTFKGWVGFKACSERARKLLRSDEYAFIV